MTEREQELVQLDEFHERLAALEPAAQASLLLNGFLPDDGDTLIEAGIRCLPLIESGAAGIADGAVHRLETVLFKLRLSPETAASRRVSAQFEKVVADHRKTDRENLRYGTALIAGLAVAAAGVIGFIAYSLLK